jgi:glycosyltransferase involved in cell wall biosynthesis
MSRPLVTCIVPVFNCEAYLAESIDSILAQAHRPLEIIVVDDGSTDGTAAVIDSFGDKVRGLRQANAGPAVARNTGLAAAHGDFIAFNDSDDLWAPEKLAVQLALLDAKPDLDFCVAHVQNFWVEEMQDEADRYRGHRRSEPIAGWVSPTLLARRAAFDRVGRMNAELGHGDSADWFLRAREAGLRGELLPDVLLRRRIHANNRSRKAAPQSRDEFLALLKRNKDRRKEVPSS